MKSFDIWKRLRKNFEGEQSKYLTQLVLEAYFAGLEDGKEISIAENMLEETQDVIKKLNK